MSEVVGSQVDMSQFDKVDVFANGDLVCSGKPLGRYICSWCLVSGDDPANLPHKEDCINIKKQDH